jgi:hypothetical protein
MSPLATRYKTEIPPVPCLYHNHIQDSSTGSAATSVFEQTPGRKSSLSSTSSNLDHDGQHQYIQQHHLNLKEDMTTYYCYGEDGTVTSSLLDPNAPVFTRGLQGTTSFEQHGDIVGAYLARRDITYPAPTGQETHGYEDNPYQSWCQPLDSSAISEPIEQSRWSSDEHESSGYPNSSRAESVSTLGYAGWASHSGIAHPYPNPDDIRHMHTLHSLLKYLQPERRLSALAGPTVDVIEQDTGVVFASQVPKKLLVLFLGRRVVNRYIRTIQRQDDKTWSGPPICQEMRLPRGKSSKSAIRVLIAWMARACQYHTMGTMNQIRVPKRTFVACSLAQTMELFGLHKDALRVDHFIAHTHFVRPIFAGELEALWKCLGEESRYVFAAIRVVGKRLQEHEEGSKTIPGIDDDMYAMLKKHPRLEARVRDLELNERYRPSFGTDWTRRLGGYEHDNTNPPQGESKSGSFYHHGPKKDLNKSQIPDIEDTTRGLRGLDIASNDSMLSMAHAESGHMPQGGNKRSQS